MDETRDRPQVSREALRLAEELLPLSPPERRARLDQQRDQDPQLAAEVEALLEADRGAGRFLEIPALGSWWEREGKAVDGEPTATTAGGFLGRYRLLREIGAGGMGRVYLGLRADDEYRQKVAVKVVPGPADDELRQRFARERQILADLVHPGIARLLDGGTGPDGTPFLVLEYIEGQPLLDFCRDRDLGPDQRLALFLEICEAVRYAHSRLVVHRDLKPANILIDDQGRPKLLDFGIAKLVQAAGDPGDEATDLTRPGRGPLTPGYASPEQLLGEPIGTGSDIYSLGVLLYEMLSGELPRRIRAADPATLEDDLRQTPPRLGRGRDLDAVLAKALRRRPERRYGSVEAFMEDLRRYRRGLPVGARPDSLPYRAGLFVRRHRLAVGAAGIAAVLLLAVALERTVQARTLRAERDRVAVESAKAQELSDFLVELIASSHPWHRAGGDTTVLEMLASGERRLRQGAVAAPPVRALMLDRIGSAYRQHYELDKARTLLTEALTLRREHLPPDSPELAESLTNLGIVETDAGRYEIAAGLHEEAVEIRRMHSQDSPNELAKNLLYLGHTRLISGQYSLSEQAAREALELRRGLRPEDHPDLAEAESHLALALAQQGKVDEAAPRFERAIEILRRSVAAPERWSEELDELKYQLSVQLVYQGRLLRTRGELERAEANLREALELRRPYYQGSHPQIEQCLSDLAAVLAARGELEEADELYSQVLATDRDKLGEEHPDHAKTLVNLAGVRARLGRLEEADALFERGLGIARRVAPGHPGLAGPLERHARLKLSRGDRAAARLLAEEALAVRQATLGEEHPSLAATRELLAEIGRGAGAAEQPPPAR